MSHALDPAILAAGVDWLHGWKWTGNFTTLDLIAAGTNALNGALLARRPDHYKNFTVVGIILMALLMGLGGGMTRDVLLNKIPGALLNPAYITVCLVAGIIGYRLAYDSGQLFREGLFQFMTSFSLPLYAIVGAQAGVKAGLPGRRCGCTWWSGKRSPAAWPRVLLSGPSPGASAAPSSVCGEIAANGGQPWYRAHNANRAGGPPAAPPQTGQAGAVPAAARARRSEAGTTLLTAADRGQAEDGMERLDSSELLGCWM
jgi:hypothetical protein